MGLSLASPPPQSSFEKNGRIKEFIVLLEQQDGIFNGEEDYFVGEKKFHNMELESKEHETRLSKVCSRGHWRPAEDAKLRKLVAHFGPQNWNLIAENLEGRSGEELQVEMVQSIGPKNQQKRLYKR